MADPPTGELWADANAVSANPPAGAPTPRPAPALPSRPRGQLWPLATVILGALLVIVAFARVDDLLPSPSPSNPVQQEVVERPRPDVLKAIQDISRYQGATGQFQVTVDVEKDAKYLPSWLAGERTVLLAGGSVDAEVDFSTIGQGAVQVAEDGSAVTITLPRAQLSKPSIDPAQTSVVDTDKGLTNRVSDALSGDNPDNQELYLRAEDKLAAAAAESDLLARAETNTRNMLVSMLGSLGYPDVTVNFESPPT